MKFGGHHASKFGIIYSNGGHIGFYYTHTSLKCTYAYMFQSIKNAGHHVYCEQPVEFNMAVNKVCAIVDADYDLSYEHRSDAYRQLK